jgi:hypothetical protein
MIFSIAILDICDFKAIGRKMPSGTGVDATLDNGAVVGKHRKRKRNVKTSDNTDNIVRAFEHSEVREDKRYALRMLLEFGTRKEKAKARKELNVLAFGKTDAESDTDTASIDVDDSESDTE